METSDLKLEKRLAKIMNCTKLAVLGFYAVFLFSCSDVGESSSIAESSSSSDEASSSSVALSSSSAEYSSSSEASSSSVKTYTVTYITGLNEPAVNQTKIHDVALTLSSAIPTHFFGYAFMGWNTSNDGSGMSYSSGAIYTDNSDVTLYAQWVETCTITYDANNGKDGTGVVVPGNQTKIRDVALTLSTAVPTRIGYTFAGWNTSADGTGVSYAPGASYTDNYNVTLYAQWNNQVVSNCNGQ